MVKAVEVLRDAPGFEEYAIVHKGVGAGDLMQLGLDYVSSRGQETNYSSVMRYDFKKAYGL